MEEGAENILVESPLKDDDSDYEDEDEEEEEEFITVKASLPLWATPPWPNWKDSFINREVWDASNAQFDDPTGHILPDSIKPNKWIRPDLLLETPKLVDWSALSIDLINSNIHLCEQSDLYRFMLSEISELYDYGVQSSFKLEGEGVSFVPNSERFGSSWKPWDHIYSCCKAGVKGDRPGLNSNGKYYVRLYFMGSWRRITVDDKIPLFPDGTVAVPMTSKTELWPMLLVKALLKLASLKWTYEVGQGLGKDYHFSTTEALTGWVNEWTDVVVPLTPVQLWKQLNDILPRYQGQNDPVENFWTTGKTKRERDEEKYEEMLKNQDKPQEFPPNISSNWWNYLSLSDKQPDIEYLEVSDSATTLPITIIIDSEIPTSSGIQSPFSISEMEASDEAEADFEMPDEKKNLSTKKGKKDKLKNKSKKNSGSAMTGSEAEEEGEEEASEMEAGDEADNTDKDGIGNGPKKDVSAAPSVSKTGKKEHGKNSKKSKNKNKSNAESVEERDAGSISLSVVSKVNVAKSKFLVSDETEGSKSKGRSSRRKPNSQLSKNTDDEMLTENDEETDTEGERQNSHLKPGKKHTKQDKQKGGKKGKQKSYASDGPPFPSDQDQASLEQPKRISFAEAEEETEQLSKTVKLRVPMMQEILLGVQKYLGSENSELISNLESVSGKNVPDSIKVVLTVYPRPEEKGPVVPSLLFHPISLMEVRDTPLIRDPARPVTPLWKKFRWKEWAMKKGIIPMEADPEQIRCVKAKTPFAIKTDWYHSKIGAAAAIITESPLKGTAGEEEEGYDPCVGVLDEEEEEASSPVNTSKKTTPPSEKKKSLTVLHKHKKSHSVPKDKLEDTEQEIISADEELLNEFEEEEITSAPLPTPTSEAGGLETVPGFACGNIWFNCDNIAPFVRKFCKFYSTSSTFGSCFLLRRAQEPELGDYENVLSAPTELLNNQAIPSSYKEIIDCHSDPESFNLSILFEPYKVLDIKDFHLDKTQGVDSAFYMFCDCWLQQELLISLDVLQSVDITNFRLDAFDSFKLEYPPEIFDDSILPLKIGLLLEPWDWRRDCCLQKPLINCTTNTNRSARVNLSPGRNIFRIWVAENPEDTATLTVNALIESPYSMKLSSKTPIYVGTRDEILKYMTNEPVLLLRQCEILANSIWSTFLLFGQPRAAYGPNLQNLRRCYSPSDLSENNGNKQSKAMHSLFENNFVLLVKEMNGGEIDRMMLLALRCIFLNPVLGQLTTRKASNNESSPEVLEAAENSVQNVRRVGSTTSNRRNEAKRQVKISTATFVIQRYCRGWLVRRLFLLRSKSHPKFPKIEYQIRKIAFLFARHTDSAFTKDLDAVQPPEENQSIEVIPNADHHLAEQGGSGEEENLGEKPAKIPTNAEYSPPFLPPTLVPNPPRWAVKLLKDLIQEQPSLVASHSFANCLPHQVKIKEMEGTIAYDVMKNHCAPFFRRVISVVGEGNVCTCVIQLRISPLASVVMRVIDNDTHTCLETPTNLMFMGNLKYNQLGYTIFCYRLIETPSMLPPEIEDPFLLTAEDDFSTNIVHNWKLQIITGKYTPNIQFKDEQEEETQAETSTNINEIQNSEPGSRFGSTEEEIAGEINAAEETNSLPPPTPSLSLLVPNPSKRFS